MSKNTQKYIDAFCKAINPDYPALIGSIGMDNILIAATDKMNSQARRIAELESELNNCVKVLEQVDFTSGCNGHKCVSGHIKTLIDLLKEIEAAQQWHPASEPPEDDRQVVTELNNGKFEIDYYWRPNYTEHRWKYGHENVVRWCDIPPIGKESRNETILVH